MSAIRLPLPGSLSALQRMSTGRSPRTGENDPVEAEHLFKLSHKLPRIAYITTLGLGVRLTNRFLRLATRGYACFVSIMHAGTYDGEGEMSRIDHEKQP